MKSTNSQVLFHFLIVAMMAFPSPAEAQIVPRHLQPCKNAIDAISGKTGPLLEVAVGTCERECSSRYAEPVRDSYGYQKCLDAKNTLGTGMPFAGGAGARCDSAAAMLNDGRTHEPPEWQACVDDCGLAMAEPGAPDVINRYRTTFEGCNGKITEAPVDPLADDGSTVADDDAGDTGGSTTGDLPVADTGSPNTSALNSALSGLGGTSPTSKIDPGKSVNFRGSGGTQGSYQGVAGGLGVLGPQGGDVLPPQQINNGYQGTSSEVKADVANFGGGSGGGGSGGGGMAGGASGGAPRAGAAGGPRQSAAGAQLAKQGPNQFWAGGAGGGASGKTAARTTATALKVPLVEKPKFGPEYQNKGLGNDGLLRLWGAGAGQNRLPVQRQTQSCRDGVIFCNLENFDFEFAP